MSYIIDIQQFNGSWYTEVTTTAAEAYTLVCALDDAAQVLINAEPVHTQKAIDAWYNAQTSAKSEPADVDMGGDFEGFIEEVNAQPLSPIDRAIENGELDDYVSARIEENAWSAKFDRKAGISSKPRKPSIHQEQDDMIAAQNGTQTTNQRIKQLRARIASQERELEDLRFQLSQELGE